MPPIDPVLKTIIAEALGEGPEGMRLVGETIVNRSEQRGLTPAQVVQQRRQYSGFENPGPAAVRAFNDPSAISAAQAAWELARGPGDPTGGANHYLNPRDATDLSWVGSMTPTITHGGHQFYTDRNGFQQRGLGPVAVNPAQVTPTTAALRQMTSPSGGNTALQTALNQYATRERNRVTPQTPAWLMTGMNQEPATAANPVQDAIRRAALSMGGNQTFAGQSGAGPQNLTGQGQAMRDAARRASLSTGGNQTYAGQQRGPMLERLPQGQPGLPARYGTMSPNQVNAIGVPVGARPVTTNPRVAPVPAQPSASLMASRGPAAPVPFQRPTGVATQLSVNPPQVAPVPLQRPNFGMGGPGFAPVNAGSLMAGPAPQRAPLNIMVQGSRTIQPPVQQIAPSMVNQLRAVGMTPAQAYAAANSGNGAISWAAQDRTRDGGGNSGLSSI